MQLDLVLQVTPERLLALLERIADALEGTKAPPPASAAAPAFEPLAPVAVPADAPGPEVIPPPVAAEEPARKPKRNMSAEGLANIRAASARRWARQRGDAPPAPLEVKPVLAGRAPEPALAGPPAPVVTRPAVPPELATRDGSISTARLEEMRADPGPGVAMAWADIVEWGKRWAPEVIAAGGRPMVVIAALNKHKAREGLPPIRLGKNMFTATGALPSAGLGGGPG